MKKPDLNLKASIASLAVAVTVSVLSFNSSPAEGVDSPAQDPDAASGVHPIFTGVDVTGDADIQGEIVNSEGVLPVLINDSLEIRGDFNQYDGDVFIENSLEMDADLTVNGSAGIAGGLNVEGEISNDGEDHGGAVRVEDNVDVSGYLVVGIDYDEALTNWVKIYKDGMQSMVEHLYINTVAGGQDIYLGSAPADGEQSNDTIIRGNLFNDVNNLLITDSVDLDGILTITEDAEVGGDLDVGNDLDVGGAASVDDLSIGGTITYSATDLDIERGIRVDGNGEFTGKIKAAGIGDYRIIKSVLEIPATQGYYVKNVYCPDNYIAVSCSSYFDTNYYIGAQGAKYFTTFHFDEAGSFIGNDNCRFHAVNVIPFNDEDKGLKIPLHVQTMCFNPNLYDDGYQN